MKTCVGIYGIVNTETDQIYVGQTIDFAVRKKNHFTMLKGNRHPNNHLQRSFNKYGRGPFRFVVLCRCDISELVQREQEWIDRTPRRLRFNQADSAENPMLGRTHTPEARRKMREKLKGRPKRIGWKHSSATIEKIRLSKVGKKMSAEARAKMSQSQIGRVVSEATREKLRQQKLGKKRSKAARAAISAGKKGVRLSEEHKAAISRGLDRRDLTPELREKFRLANLGKKRTAASRKRISEGLKGKPKSEEAKAAMKAAAQRRWADPEYRQRMVEVRRGRRTPKKYKTRT